MKEIEAAENQIDTRQSTSAHQRQGPTAPFLHREEGHEGEHQIGYARDHNVDECVVHVISGILEYLLSVIEDDIRAAPLLEKRDNATKQEDSVERFA